MTFSLLHWGSSDQPPRNRASDLITDPAKIAVVLQQIIDERISLTIQLPGTQQTFCSTVFEVDKKNLEFCIDELVPRNGHDIIIGSKRLSAKGQGHGPEIAFSAEMIKVGKSAGVPYYKLQFPKNIKYTERRAMFRAKVSPAKRIDFSCMHADTVLRGHVVDVSGLGIGVVLYGAGEITPDDTLQACQLILPEGGELNFDLNVRHTRKLQNERTHVGAKFMSLSREDKKRIGKFVRCIERDSLCKRRRET